MLRFALAKQTTTRNIYINIYLFFSTDACVNSGISLPSVQNRRPYIAIKLPSGDMDTPLRPRNLLL